MTVVSACGGDDGDDEKDSTPTGAAEDQADCEATVKLTGAVKASWTGAGFVITGGGNDALYKTSKGDRSVTVIPGQDDVPAIPTVTAKGTTFTVQPGEGKVDVDPDGGGLDVDADAVTTKNGKSVTVHLVTSFDC
jgi:hypothetical protein